MGTDHDFFIVLASKYPALRDKFIEYYGPKDGQKDIAKSAVDSLHSGMTKEEISQKLTEVFKALLNEDKEKVHSYQQYQNFEAILKSNTIHVKSIRNYLLKTNIIDSFEYYSAGIGMSYSVSTRSQVALLLETIQPQNMNMGFGNEAVDLLRHILQMIDNIGEECYVIMETNY